MFEVYFSVKLRYKLNKCGLSAATMSLYNVCRCVSCHCPGHEAPLCPGQMTPVCHHTGVTITLPTPPLSSHAHISVCGVKTLVPAPRVTPRSTLNIMDFPDTVEIGICESGLAGGDLHIDDSVKGVHLSII